MTFYAHLSGGTGSYAETVKVNNDFHAAAREADRRHQELQRRNDEMILNQRRLDNERHQREREEQQRQFEQRAAEERRRQDQQRADDMRRMEQQRAEDARRQEERQRSNGGNGGYPPNNGSGGSGGQNPLNGFSRDMRNLADPNATVTRLSAADLNAQERQRRGEGAISPYGSDPYKTRTNPHPEPIPVIQFGKRDSDNNIHHGEWHASIDDMQRRSVFFYNHAAGGKVEDTAQRYLDLSYKPTDYSFAHLGPKVTNLTLSHTISGHEQAQINSGYMRYSEPKPVETLMSWLKFKSG